ncbi:MAG: hypothetical protein HY648_05450 [Acidobacteria bacterium]|nr:hypothetical protein [Acidobacteriota bacterium]
MRRLMILFASFAVALCLSTLPAAAQRGRGAGGSGGGPMGSPGSPGMSGSQKGGMQGGMGQGQGTHHPEMGGQMGGEHRGQPHEAQTGKRPTVAHQLERNERLRSKLQGVLPAGTDLQQAATGFKNLGEFVAAAHVSHNLGIPFANLKAKMSTGSNLGEAIHELKPDVDHNAEAKKAREQARKVLKESGS